VETKGGLAAGESPRNNTRGRKIKVGGEVLAKTKVHTDSLRPIKKENTTKVWWCGVGGGDSEKNRSSNAQIKKGEGREAAKGGLEREKQGNRRIIFKGGETNSN